MLGWNALGGRCDTIKFDGWCSETRVCIQEQMVLEMPSENRQSQGRGKYGWAAYSRPGMLWMKKILKWPLMFSLNGADMVIEEEDRSDREGVYLGRI